MKTVACNEAPTGVKCPSLHQQEVLERYQTASVVVEKSDWLIDRQFIQVKEPLLHKHFLQALFHMYM